MVKRNLGPLTSEDLANLRTLVGGENILAECNGVNYQVYVTESRLLVGKRFTLGEHYVNVPATKVNTLELITKSLLPPLTYAILAAIATFLIWWFPAGQRILPVSPYDIILGVGILVFLAALAIAWWRRAVGILRIGIDGTEEPITVKLVSTSKAAHVFNALKG
jgi:hypothetical protein